MKKANTISEVSMKIDFVPETLGFRTLIHVFCTKKQILNFREKKHLPLD